MAVLNSVSDAYFVSVFWAGFRLEILIYSIQYHMLFSVCSGRDNKCEIPFLYNGHLHFECSSNSPVTGDLFGRCPTKLLNKKTREASLKVKNIISKDA